MSSLLRIHIFFMLTIWMEARLWSHFHLGDMLVWWSRTSPEAQRPLCYLRVAQTIMGSFMYILVLVTEIAYYNTYQLSRKSNIRLYRADIVQILKILQLYHHSQLHSKLTIFGLEGPSVTIYYCTTLF